MIELNWTLYFAFLLVGVVAAITPGPTILLTLSQSLLLNQRKLISTLVGLITGSILFGLLTLYGTGTMLMTTPYALKTIKIMGGTILLYFGFLKVINVTSNKKNKVEKKPTANSKQDYLLGLLTAILSPKIFLFYIFVIPQFVDPRYPMKQQLIILVMTQLILKASSLITYASVSSRLQNKLYLFTKLSKLNFLSGVMLITAAFIVFTVG